MSRREQLRQEAWHRMYQKRTCPPIGVLQKGGGQVEQHLRSCSDCREMLAKRELYTNAGQFLAALPRKRGGPSEPTVGDIRRIQPLGAAETWFDGEGRYHNPPLVLIVEGPDAQGRVRVAQIFNEADLSDEGDIALGDYGFAEAWNTYGIFVSQLAKKALHRVDADVVERVLLAARKDYPAMDTQSALYWFRLCEADTGSFFGLSLNAEALQGSAQVMRIHTETDKTSLLGRLHEILEHWSEYLVPLPAAAATRISPVTDESETYTLPCILSDLSKASKPQCLPCDVHLHRLDAGFVVTAYVDLKCAQDVFVDVRCGTASSDSKVRVREDAGKLCIVARFAHDALSPQDLKITILLYDEDVE